MPPKYDGPGAVARAAAGDRIAERQAVSDSTHTRPAPGAPALRLTVSAAYRHGSEVLLVDSGPLPDLAAVRDALTEIDSALDTHADLIFERGAELVIRVAERRFQRQHQSAAPAQKRVAHRGEF